jgi:hypothetical protein
MRQGYNKSKTKSIRIFIAKVNVVQYFVKSSWMPFPKLFSLHFKALISSLQGVSKLANSEFRAG